MDEAKTIATQVEMGVRLSLEPKKAKSLEIGERQNQRE